MAIDRCADGTITSVGVTPRLVVGPLAAIWQPVLQAWRTAGIVVEEVADARPAQWEKTILNATVGPLCLATGKSMAEVWNDPELQQLALAATAEGEAIALNQGIHIAPHLCARAHAFFERVGCHRPSILRDPGELPSILGHLRSCAHTPTPALDRISTLVSTHMTAFQAATSPRH
jgi:ketopantoate reductase